MEYEIYLDMFFLVNFYMDYMIMWAVTKILKITQHVYIRRIGAAAVGALYATLIIAFRLNGAVWKIMTYAVIVLLMSFILTGKKKIRQIIGGAGLIYLFAITLGGILHVILLYLRRICSAGTRSIVGVSRGRRSNVCAVIAKHDKKYIQKIIS